MNNDVSPSNFTTIKPPDYYYTRKLVAKKKYLDELYMEEWLNKYFNIDKKPTIEKSTSEK